MTLINAKEVIAEAIQAAFEDEAAKKNLPAIVTDEMLPKFDAIAAWAIGENSKPGLVLHGAPQTMEKNLIGRAIYSEANWPIKAVYLTCIDIAMMAQHEGRASLFEPEYSPGKVDFLFIDEMGWEPRVVNYRGINADGDSCKIEINPLAEVILYRHKQGLPVIITTEYDQKTLAKLYGSAVADSIRENCEIVNI